eukprot:CAMPEP_0176467864 /NCGR_PEP_ID=MMETSP0127-20121128/38699_1 /TAXON_ID=938130 /ORGANISM="Platyophrya macrostoma, Strain WH" /LENGTH=64 /DNA_ID=CAMNT_0017861219 /DNA_START=198 /DNA_END=392 /DNA_ORIENTATION=-
MNASLGQEPLPWVAPCYQFRVERIQDSSHRVVAVEPLDTKAEPSVIAPPYPIGGGGGGGKARGS